MSGIFPTDLALEIGVIKNGNYFRVSETDDHLIIGPTWHSINLETLAELQGILNLVEVELGQIDAAAAFRLSSEADGSRYLLDQIDRHDAPSWADQAETKVPPALNASLYPYQQVGYRALKGLSDGGIGALLADEMGLGKTIQAIALLVALRPSRSIAVVPASLLENWSRELHQFAPTLSVFVHAGTHRPGLINGLDGFDIILTTYETVVSDIAMLSDTIWDLVILDEAQQIRNPMSQRSIAVKRLPRRLGLVVTGTPVENSLRDLWSLSEFVLPSLLGRLPDFQENYPDDFAAAVRLGEIISPITIRRSVAQVAADLPQKVEIQTALRLGDRERVAYAEIEQSRNAFEANTALRVICAHAASDSTMTTADFSMTPKVQHLTGLLEEVFERSEKALVFSSFSNTLARLQSHLDDVFRQAHFRIIDGSTPITDRQLIIDQFSKSPHPGALILNPKAAGVGLNITAANHVIHFNPEYNPAVTSQATARAFRRKQELPVFVHHLYYVETLEETAIRISHAKRMVANGVDAGVGLV
jgi:SNF2 family DNA or RNA helicase